MNVHTHTHTQYTLSTPQTHTYWLNILFQFSQLYISAKWMYCFFLAILLIVSIMVILDSCNVFEIHYLFFCLKWSILRLPDIPYVCMTKWTISGPGNSVELPFDSSLFLISSCVLSLLESVSFYNNIINIVLGNNPLCSPKYLMLLMLWCETHLYQQTKVHVSLSHRHVAGNSSVMHVN